MIQQDLQWMIDRWTLLQHYGADPEFARDIELLYQEHCEGHEDEVAGVGSRSDLCELYQKGSGATSAMALWARGYSSAVSGLAGKYGLDRVWCLSTPLVCFHSGIGLFHDPSEYREFREIKMLLFSERLTRHSVGRQRSAKAAPSTELVPRWGEGPIFMWCRWVAWFRLGLIPHREFSARDFGAIHPWPIPPNPSDYYTFLVSIFGSHVAQLMCKEDHSMTIQISDEWYPGLESAAASKQRILAEADRQVTAAQDRILSHATDRGFMFPTRRELERDLMWLFWKLRHGLSYGRIVQRTAIEHPDWLRKGRKDRRVLVRDSSDDTRLVQKAILRVAEYLHIDRSGWENE
jgi:hypothetical protein